MFADRLVMRCTAWQGLQGPAIAAPSLLSESGSNCRECNGSSRDEQQTETSFGMPSFAMTCDGQYFPVLFTAEVWGFFDTRHG